MKARAAHEMNTRAGMTFAVLLAGTRVFPTSAACAEAMSPPPFCVASRLCVVNPIVVSAAATGIGGGAEQVRELRKEVASA